MALLKRINIGNSQYCGRRVLVFQKIKRSDSENEPSRNISVVDGIKISIHAKRDAEQLTEAEKHRAMKDNSTTFDYNL